MLARSMVGLAALGAASSLASSSTGQMPSGLRWDAALRVEAPGYLDDFVMLTPTGDPKQQVMYTAMTDGRIAPFATMAILLNP